jgi:hypothetical protein
LGIGEVLFRDAFGVERGVVFEIAGLEGLGVDLVDLIEFEALVCLVIGEGADCLGGEGAAIDEEEDAAGDAGLHEAVDLVDRGVGLAGAGGHGDEHAALAFGEGGFDGIVGGGELDDGGVVVAGKGGAGRCGTMCQPDSRRAASMRRLRVRASESKALAGAAMDVYRDGWRWKYTLLC